MFKIVFAWGNCFRKHCWSRLLTQSRWHSLMWMLRLRLSSLRPILQGNRQVTIWARTLHFRIETLCNKYGLNTSGKVWRLRSRWLLSHLNPVWKNLGAYSRDDSSTTGVPSENSLHPCFSSGPAKRVTTKSSFFSVGPAKSVTTTSSFFCFNFFNFFQTNYKNNYKPNFLIVFQLFVSWPP